MCSYLFTTPVGLLHATQGQNGTHAAPTLRPTKMVWIQAPVDVCWSSKQVGGRLLVLKEHAPRKESKTDAWRNSLSPSAMVKRAQGCALSRHARVEDSSHHARRHDATVILIGSGALNRGQRVDEVEPLRFGLNPPVSHCEVSLATEAARGD